MFLGDESKNEYSNAAWYYFKTVTSNLVDQDELDHLFSSARCDEDWDSSGGYGKGVATCQREDKLGGIAVVGA